MDNNLLWIDRLKAGGAFPFHEPGYRLPSGSDTWRVQDSLEGLEDVDAFIVTVGTPLDSNLSPKLGPIKSVVDALTSYIAAGKLLIFRSTLGLGVTRAIAKYLTESIGLGFEPQFAYCPERLAEGKAREEIFSLPQIVSVDNDQTYKKCEQIFSKLAPRLHRVSYREAELIKLLCNTSRYMNFAVANWVHEFLLMNGADPHSLVAIANDGYPRPIPDRAGFTAGTCLRKDYGLLVQDQVLGDYPLAAWRVNERQPLSLLNAVKERVKLTDKTVAILGVAFKRDVDDIRDSLALKLAEILLPEADRVFYQDPFLGKSEISLGLTPIRGENMDAVREHADVIIVGANHSDYDGLADEIRQWGGRKRLIIDIWNVLGFGNTVTELPI